MLHLRNHGINAVKYRAIAEEDEIADALSAAVRDRMKIIEMPGYIEDEKLAMPSAICSSVNSRRRG
ncbi:hypothetical protein M2175_003873 [Bradyrhizobium elkanii]|uniref:hypothetical protein n=1 Tax=Bradyrhizobium TaxID=374 RepID=UPI002168516D|nr:MULTISPECIES: hypothetical protein [Bradyrhizobium]MCS3928842.1 hypothetical protein [Bradyrhizobium elkanii]MCS3969396.1 hypothetical protein [Bradyrhizobium japonicum]